MNFREVEVSTRRGPKFYINVNFDTKGIIRVKNDRELKDALSRYGGHRVANECKYMYERIHGEKIDIYTNSIGIELYGHVYPGDIAKAVSKAPVPSSVVEFCNKVLKRTDIIDCGEAKYDKNRWIWDLFGNGDAYGYFRDFI